MLDQVFSNRYEKASLLVTSNLAFAEWTRVFGEASLTAALLDRLTHRCQIYEFDWESIRLAESLKRQKKVPSAKSQAAVKIVLRKCLLTATQQCGPDPWAVDLHQQGLQKGLHGETGRVGRREGSSVRARPHYVPSLSLQEPQKIFFLGSVRTTYTKWVTFT